MKKHVKMFLGSLRGKLNSWLEPRGFKVINRTEANQADLTSLIALLCQGADRIFMLQVGAHDGVTGDHLHWLRTQPHWSGFLLEPNPAIFPRLAANCGRAGNPGITPLQVALGSEDGTLSFYRIVPGRKDHRLAAWSDQWSSLSRERLIQECMESRLTRAEAEALIEEIPVTTLTMESFLSKHAIRVLDVVLFDVEGMDFPLLQALPLDRYHPRIVICEWPWMSAEQIELAIRKFNDHGYDWMQVGRDLAFIRRVDPSRKPLLKLA